MLWAFFQDGFRAGPKAHGVLQGLHVRFPEKSSALKGYRVPWEAASRAWVTEVCTKREHLGPWPSLSPTTILTPLSYPTLFSGSSDVNDRCSSVRCTGTMVLISGVHVVSVWGVGLREDGVSSLRVKGLSRAAVAVQSPCGSASAAGAEMAAEATSAAARLHDGVRCAADKQWVDHVLPRRPVHSRTSGKQTVL